MVKKYFTSQFGNEITDVEIVPMPELDDYEDEYVNNFWGTDEETRGVAFVCIDASSGIDLKSLKLPNRYQIFLAGIKNNCLRLLLI